MFSFLSLGWGLISDIDIESERIRSIGYQRFAIWSVHRLINLRTYYGTLSYLPVKNRNTTDNAKNITSSAAAAAAHRRKLKSNGLRHSQSYNVGLTECCECNGIGDCEMCDSTFSDILSLETNAVNDAFNNNNSSNNNANIPYRSRLDSWHSAHSKKSAYFSTTESVYQSVGDEISDYGSEINDLDGGGKHTNQIYGPASKIPALTAPVPADWTIETGEFIMVHASYQSHIASDCQFAPLSQLNDGIIWMLVIRAGATRQEIFKFLISMSSGTHVPSAPNQHIEMIPVTAFRIEPTGTQGHFTVDGERIEYGPIQAEIFPGLSQVLVPKPQQST